MINDCLSQVPKDWIEQRMDRLAAAYEAIKESYWIKWEGGYTWKFCVKSPGREWHRPTLEQVIERQAMFAGVHKSLMIGADGVRRVAWDKMK